MSVIVVGNGEGGMREGGRREGGEAVVTMHTLRIVAGVEGGGCTSLSEEERGGL